MNIRFLLLIPFIINPSAACADGTAWSQFATYVYRPDMPTSQAVVLTMLSTSVAVGGVAYWMHRRAVDRINDKVTNVNDGIGALRKSAEGLTTRAAVLEENQGKLEHRVADLLRENGVLKLQVEQLQELAEVNEQQGEYWRDQSASLRELLEISQTWRATHRVVLQAEKVRSGQLTQQNKILLERIKLLKDAREIWRDINYMDCEEILFLRIRSARLEVDKERYDLLLQSYAALQDGLSEKERRIEERAANAEYSLLFKTYTIEELERQLRSARSEILDLNKFVLLHQGNAEKWQKKYNQLRLRDGLWAQNTRTFFGSLSMICQKIRARAFAFGTVDIATLRRYVSFMQTELIPQHDIATTNIYSFLEKSFPQEADDIIKIMEEREKSSVSVLVTPVDKVRTNGSPSKSSSQPGSPEHSLQGTSQRSASSSPFSKRKKRMKKQKVSSKGTPSLRLKDQSK